MRLRRLMLMKGFWVRYWGGGSQTLNGAGMLLGRSWGHKREGWLGRKLFLVGWWLLGWQWAKKIWFCFQHRKAEMEKYHCYPFHCNSPCCLSLLRVSFWWISHIPIARGLTGTYNTFRQWVFVDLHKHLILVDTIKLFISTWFWHVSSVFDEWDVAMTIRYPFGRKDATNRLERGKSRCKIGDIHSVLLLDVAQFFCLHVIFGDYNII